MIWSDKERVYQPSLNVDGEWKEVGPPLPSWIDAKRVADAFSEFTGWHWKIESRQVPRGHDEQA